jgi:hypothetical protein
MENEEIYYSSFSRQIEIPQFSEPIDNYRNIVKWGVDNLYCQYLLSLYDKSPLHNAILNKKIRMIGGSGFLKNNLNEHTTAFIRNVWGEDDMECILQKISFDLEMFGSFTLMVVWSKDRKKIAKIEYVNRANVRVIPSDDEKDIVGFDVSEGWHNTRKYIAERYLPFSAKDREDGCQILYVKGDMNDNDWNGRPSYLSIVNYIESQYGISEFILNDISNGFSAQLQVDTKITNASRDQKQAIVDNYKAQFEGEKGWRTVYTFSPVGSEQTSFIPIPKDTTSEMFVNVNESISKNILQGHGIKPILVTETSGQLGSRNEILEATELFQCDYIEPKQYLIETILNKLCRLSFPDQVTDKIIIKRYSDNYVTVNTNMDEIISLLSSSLTAEQKYKILLMNGYTEVDAKELSGSIQNNLQ